MISHNTLTIETHRAGGGGGGGLHCVSALRGRDKNIVNSCAHLVVEQTKALVPPMHGSQIM